MNLVFFSVLLGITAPLGPYILPVVVGYLLFFGVMHARNVIDAYNANEDYAGSTSLVKALGGANEARIKEGMIHAFLGKPVFRSTVTKKKGSP